MIKIKSKRSNNYNDNFPATKQKEKKKKSKIGEKDAHPRVNEKTTEKENPILCYWHREQR